MTPEECAVADWEQLGERDARAGKTPEYFSRRASDCAEAGYSADADAWQTGWDRGIVDFCRPERGFREGLEGNRYEHICPRHLEPDFLQGYESGIAIHDARERLRKIESDIEDSNERLAELRTSDSPERDAIDAERKRLKRLHERLRQQELELERLLGVAEGRGFRP